MKNKWRYFKEYSGGNCKFTKLLMLGWYPKQQEQKENTHSQNKAKNNSTARSSTIIWRCTLHQMKFVLKFHEVVDYKRKIEEKLRDKTGRLLKEVREIFHPVQTLKYKRENLKIMCESSPGMENF